MSGRGRDEELARAVLGWWGDPFWEATQNRFDAPLLALWNAMQKYKPVPVKHYCMPTWEEFVRGRISYVDGYVYLSEADKIISRACYDATREAMATEVKP